MGEPSFGAGAMGRIPVGQVDEIGTDRLDPEDLHAPVCHPVNGLGGDATEAVEERGRPGSAVVVVAAEEEDVSRPQLLSARGHRGPNLVRAHVMAARVLADVDADRLAAERVERHLLKRCAARLIVAESVDVRRRMVRGDDDLGAEGRVSGRRVGVENVAEDLRWWKERVQLRFARERLREIETRRVMRLLLSCHFSTNLNDPGNDGVDDPLARLGARAGGVTDHARLRDIAEHVHRDDHLRPGVAHAVLAEGRPLETRLPDGGAAVPGVPRREVHLDALPERDRERGLGLLGVDHRTIDVDERVGGEIPPLDEEDATAGRLEVMVHRDGQGRGIAAVPVDGDEVLGPCCASESQTSRKTWKNVVVCRRIEPGNCMWYHERVMFSVGATRIETPSCSPSAAARDASVRAMKQSVSSGIWGPCCSVVPIGISTASTPAPIRAPTSGQVIRSMKCSATREV